MHTPNAARTSLVIDSALIAEAGRALGTKGKTQTIRRALEAAIATERRKQLASWELEDLSLTALAELRRTTRSGI